MVYYKMILLQHYMFCIWQHWCNEWPAWKNRLIIKTKIKIHWYINSFLQSCILCCHSTPNFVWHYEKSSSGLPGAAIVQKQKHSTGHKSVFYNSGLFYGGSNYLNTCSSLTQSRQEFKHTHCLNNELIVYYPVQQQHYNNNNKAKGVL